MREYRCIKDFYYGSVKFASEGDKVVLLQDGTTVVNLSSGQKLTHGQGILNNKDKFYEVKGDNDRVNHPNHYTWLKEKCGIEVIDITRWLDFDTGNAVKYLLRAGYKTEEGYSDKQKEIEDLQKAIWYINDKINQLQK